MPSELKNFFSGRVEWKLFSNIARHGIHSSIIRGMQHIHSELSLESVMFTFFTCPYSLYVNGIAAGGVKVC